MSTRTGQPNRPSRKTSCSEEMFTPVLGCGRLSRRDQCEGPLLRCTPGCLLHLLNQAALTLFCIRTGAVSALALARHLKNSAVSADQRPPVSAASTTSRTRPSSPANSGWCVPPSSCVPVSVPHLGVEQLRASWCRLGGRVTPSLCRWYKWAPWNKANPSAMTSILRPSNPLILGQIQVADENVRRHPGHLLPCTLVPPHIPEDSPFHPRPLPQSTLHDDGQSAFLGVQVFFYGCKRPK